MKTFPFGGSPPEGADHKSEDDGTSKDHTEEDEYKARYKQLKVNFLRAVETHEYIRCELRRHQRQLQFLQEDKNFLLDRILLYDKPPESPESVDGGGSDSEPDNAGGKRSKSNHGVTIASAFSKVKSLSKRTRKSKLKTFEDVVESPSESLGTFEDDSCSMGMGSVGFTFPTQDDSE